MDVERRRWKRSRSGRDGIRYVLRVEKFVDHYNAVRLHSAIGFVAPADKLAGREDEIHAARDRKLEAARELRRQRRAAERGAAA